MNPAKRLLVAYDALMKQKAEGPMSQAWAAVFELEPNTPHLEDEITRCLMALRQEIDLTRAALKAHDVDENLMSPGFDRFRNVAAPGQLHSAWKSHQDTIGRPECRKVFEWAAWVLRGEDEGTIAEDELTALRRQIEELEEALAESELSPYLLDFITNQLDTIRNALRIYGVQGARPLREAFQKVAGTYATERAHIDKEIEEATPAAKTLFSKAGAAFKKTAEICDDASKIGRAGAGAISFVKTALEFLP